MAIRKVGHVLIYPPEGKLLFATDLHGQLSDFRRMINHYRCRREQGEDIYLLFAGDFVHGPNYTKDEWPEMLGDFHTDGTLQILEELEELMAYDDRVRSLLGNHEHAHIGGPPTTKFHWDPNEVEHLEHLLGKERSARARALFRTFALAALTPCGILFLHGAPNVHTGDFSDVANAKLEGHENVSILELFNVPVIGEILWARGADVQVTEQFLERMTFEDIRPHVVVFGHDIIREGFYRETSNQLIVSTSFGLKCHRKTYCEIDLSRQYYNSSDLVEGSELLPLYG